MPAEVRPEIVLREKLLQQKRSHNLQVDKYTNVTQKYTTNIHTFPKSDQIRSLGTIGTIGTDIPVFESGELLVQLEPRHFMVKPPGSQA